MRILAVAIVLQSCLAVTAASGQSPACSLVSSAAGSYTTSSVAPGSLVTMYAAGISTGVFVASDQIPDMLPTNLGGVSAKITDASGSTFSLSLIAVTQNQANALLPKTLATGVATVALTGIGGSKVCLIHSNVTIQPISPYLFTSDESGGWLAAAQVILVHADGTTGPPIAVSQYSNSPEWNGVAWSNWIPTPVNLGASTDTAILVLYGTGIADGTAQYAAAAALGYTTTVSLCQWQPSYGLVNDADYCRGNGQGTVNVSYAGAQGAGSNGSFYGLDQVNVIIPRSYVGAGMTSVNVILPKPVLTMQGIVTYEVSPINAVLIDIQ